MLMFVSTTCLRPLHSTTCDNLQWHFAVCSSLIPFAPLYVVYTGYTVKSPSC